jgi:hypothetical protein
MLRYEFVSQPLDGLDFSLITDKQISGSAEYCLLGFTDNLYVTQILPIHSFNTTHFLLNYITQK